MAALGALLARVAAPEWLSIRAFVYAFEDHPEFGPRHRRYREPGAGEYLACASVLALGEVLTGLTRRGART